MLSGAIRFPLPLSSALQGFRATGATPASLLNSTDTMFDSLFQLAVAETFLQPTGPIARAQLDHLNYVVILTCIAIVPALIALPLILWRYRRSNRKAKYRPNWDSNIPLEIAMWGLPIVVIVLMAFSLWSITQRLDPYEELGQDPLEIKVIGLDWKWVFLYPDEKVAFVDELIVPVGRPVELEMTSDTVMQSLRISALVGQIYAMPAMTTKLNFIAADVGEARGMNTQFTGLGMWRQKFLVHSVPADEYQKRIEEARQSPISLNEETYAILAQQGTAAEAKTPLGLTVLQGPAETQGTATVVAERDVPVGEGIAMRLPEPKIFDRVLARYKSGVPMTPETQPGSPSYDPAKASLPPLTAVRMEM